MLSLFVIFELFLFKIDKYCRSIVAIVTDSSPSYQYTIT